jgi:hypothetical protein
MLIVGMTVPIIRDFKHDVERDIMENSHNNKVIQEAVISCVDSIKMTIKYSMPNNKSKRAFCWSVFYYP